MSIIVVTDEYVRFKRFWEKQKRLSCNKKKDYMSLGGFIESNHTIRTVSDSEIQTANDT